MAERKENHYLETPLITVLTLSYNSEYLYDSVKSVLEQTYPRIEYVIVDDGSEVFDADKVQSFINAHKRENLVDYKVIVNPLNMGTVKASNIAIRHSTGEYLFNLAADDVFFDAEVLDRWVGEFVRRGSLIMTAQSAVYDSTLTVFQRLLPEEKEIAVLKTGSSQKVFEQLCYANFIYGCCTARSKKLIQKYGLYNEAYRIIDDYSSALQLSRQGVGIDYWAQPVIKYRQGGVSSSYKFNKIYEHDSDLIFQCEIIPYTTKKLKMKLHYYIWKCDRIESSHFYNTLQKINDSHRGWLLPLLWLRFPVPALRGFKYKVLQKVKE